MERTNEQIVAQGASNQNALLQRNIAQLRSQVETLESRQLQEIAMLEHRAEAQHEATLSSVAQEMQAVKSGAQNAALSSEQFLRSSYEHEAKAERAKFS